MMEVVKYFVRGDEDIQHVRRYIAANIDHQETRAEMVLDEVHLPNSRSDVRLAQIYGDRRKAWETKNLRCWWVEVMGGLLALVSPDLANAF